MISTSIQSELLFKSLFHEVARNITTILNILVPRVAFWFPFKICPLLHLFEIAYPVWLLPTWFFFKKTTTKESNQWYHDWFLP